MSHLENQLDNMFHSGESEREALIEELETLRAEKAKLIAEREAVKSDLDMCKLCADSYEDELKKMHAEREAMMKQEPTRWLNPHTNHTISNSTKFTNGGDGLFSGYCIKLFGATYVEDNDANSEISKKPWRINIDATGDYFISAADGEHVADVNSEYDAKLIVNAVNNFYLASPLPAQQIPEGYADLLDEAAEDIQDWGGYASQYFQKKHDLDGCVAKYKKASAEIKAMLSASKPKGVI